MDILEAVKLFFQDGRVVTIEGLIVLDVILAVAAAIKARVFDWRRLAEFYRSMVVPYVLGYLAFYIVGELFFVPKWLGDWSSLAGDGIQWVAWMALVGNLGADVMNSAKTLNYAFVENGGKKK